MLLLSLVLIYLSGLALSTLISCQLSFLLTVYVTTTSQVIYIYIFFFFTPDAHKRHSCCRVSVLARHGSLYVYRVQPAVEPVYRTTTSVASGLPTLQA